MLSLRSPILGVTAITFALTGVSTMARADPPARVARVSYVSGPVSLRPAGVDEWTTTTVNYPLTIGDHLWGDRGSRTELDIGSAFVRLAPATEFSVINLDDRIAQFRITQGALAVRVRALAPDDAIEIDTPSGAISLLRPGFYRIEVAESGEPSAIAVRSGEAEVSAGGSAIPVRAPQSLASGAGAPWSAVGAMASDDFEDWSLARDRRVDTSVAATYVPRDMIGYADLDPYGRWQRTSDYGAVWIPRVNAEWVPYRYGHWVSIEPWGWTWIDDAPWGFAPFHYGRWVRLSEGWGWLPGQVVARPVYAPALVAFVGGPGWQASAALGAEPVAWFPLGPREPFRPVYRVSTAYVERVNIAHVNVTTVQVANVTYVNREVPGAVTAVPREVFVRARPVATVAVAVPRESIRTAPLALVAPPPAVRVRIETVRVAAPPPAALIRPVVVRRPPPEAARAMVREGSAPPPPAAPSGAARAPRPVDRAQTPPPAPQAHPQPAAPNAALAVRHAQERAELDARHAAERADLQARHQAQEKTAADAQQRQQIRKAHQQEQQAMQERQKREREGIRKRQEDERRQKSEK